MTGLEIYKLLPKTNCKKCGYPTCLAFAMALAARKTEFGKCPDISDEARQKLSDSSRPPIKMIVLPDPSASSSGSDDADIKIGGETVLFRHEKTFFNPCGLGVYLSDTFSSGDIEDILSAVARLRFERVGKIEKTEFVFIENKNPAVPALFLQDAVRKSLDIGLVPVVSSYSPAIVEKIAGSLPAGKKIIVAAKHDDDDSSFKDYVTLCARYGLPIALECASLDDCAASSAKVLELTDGKFDEIIFLLKPDTPYMSFEILVQTRRLAIKKNFRPLGYPVMTFTTLAAFLSRESDGQEDRRRRIIGDSDIFEEAAEAAQYIEKYASVIILSSWRPEEHLALVSLRQNIYADPRKPVSVEARLYAIGYPTEKSPLLVTTNFSLTYYSVVPEIESSKVPCHLLVVDTEGMSVLTAWAADKFSPEIIKEAMEKNKVSEVISHRKIIIPGYVAVIAEKLSRLTGFEVVAGPKEVSGLPKFLKEFSVS